MYKQSLLQSLFVLSVFFPAVSEANYHLPFGQDRNAEVLRVWSNYFDLSANVVHGEMRIDSWPGSSESLTDNRSLHINDATARFLEDRTVIFNGTTNYSRFGMHLSIQAVEDEIVRGTTNAFRVETLSGFVCAFDSFCASGDEWMRVFRDDEYDNYFPAAYFISLTGDIEYAA